MKEKMTILTVWTILAICSCSKKEIMNYDVAYFKTAPSMESIEQITDVLEPVDRKIIKEGDIEFETPDVNQTKALLVKTVQELNGYFTTDNAYVNDEKIEHRVTIRVPAEKFDLLLRMIDANVDKLESKRIRAIDVTEEYIDIESRIKTKKELLARYTEILKQATKVEDLLAIEREIGALQEDIESVERRITELKDRLTFSTLNVTYYQKTKPAFGFYSKFADAIKGGWTGFMWFIIALTNLWVFIILAFVAVFAYKMWRKRRKNK